MEGRWRVPAGSGKAVGGGGRWRRAFWYITFLIKPTIEDWSQPLPTPHDRSLPTKLTLTSASRSQGTPNYVVEDLWIKYQFGHTKANKFLFRCLVLLCDWTVNLWIDLYKKIKICNKANKKLRIMHFVQCIDSTYSYMMELVFLCVLPYECMQC